MQHKKFIVTAVVALMAAVPAAGAWSSQGAFEPDTLRDVQDGFMFLEPDTDPAESKEQVYFNLIQHAYVTSVNPNVGAAKTGIRSTPTQTLSAFLGVWKDCNADGYIGAAESAIHEYRSELLLDSTICPAGGVYNSGDWVYEFRWIGWNDQTSNETNFGFRNIVNDTSSRVWADLGLPGAVGGGTCPINPQPEGTTASTGGMISYLACANGIIIEGINAADGLTGGALNLYIDPEERPQESDSTLNQRFPAHLWYDPYGETNDEKTGLLEEYESHRGDESHSKNSAFSTWDCSNPRGTAEVTDPTGQLGGVEDPTGELFDEPIAFTDEDGVIVAIPSANPSLNNPTGSYQDALNDTESGITLGGYPFADSENPHRGCQSDPTFVQGETTNEVPSGASVGNVGRRSHDFDFAFSTNLLTQINWKVLDDDVDSCVFGPIDAEDCEDSNLVEGLDGTIPEDTPTDFGVGYQRSGAFFGPMWYAVNNLVREPQLVTRDGEIAPRTILTGYAYVDTSLLSPGATRTTSTYGAEWCNGATTGVVNTFDCDASHWWNPKYDPSTSDMPTATANTDETCYDPETQEFNKLSGCRDTGVKAQQEYQLRDIDCYDGMVVYNTAYASLVPFAEGGVCQRPAGSPVPDAPTMAGVPPS